MLKNPRQLFLVFILFCLPSPVFAQEQSADEAALRALIAQYFDAYAKKDLAAFVALWSGQSPQVAARRQTLERLFSYDTFSFTAPLISHLKLEADQAKLRVATRRTARSLDGNKATETDLRVEFSFVKENGGWKLWSEYAAVSGLFSALAAAQTDAERNALLAQDAELIRSDLLLLLSSASDNAYRQADYPRALNLLASAIVVAERLGDKKELASVWHNLGIIYFMQNRLAQALAAYQKSLALEEELNRPAETARSLASIGLAHSAQGQYKTAIEFFARALTIYESLDDKNEIAQALENIGNSYYEQGDYVRAVEFYQRSLPLLAANHNAAAGRLLKLARVAYEQGQDAAAIDFYQQAATRLATSGNKRTIGYALHNIANIIYAQGDYAQALGFYQQSLKAEEEAGTRQGAMGALQGIGLIHSLNNNYPAALAAYEQNLSLAQAVGDKAEIAAAQQKVGGAHFSLGQLDQALAAYQNALVLREQIKDEQETATALLDVGVAQAAKADFVAALDAYQKSRALFEAAGNAAGMAAVLLNISLISYTQGDFAKTLALAEQAAALTRDKEAELFWQARYRAGKAHYRLARFDLARQAFTDAITTIETLRPQPQRGQQPRFYESKLAPYTAMVDVAVNENKGYEALDFAERARARTLLGVLQSAKVWINKTMTPRERAQEQQLLAHITTSHTQLDRARERSRPHQARLAELQARLQKAQLDYATFRNQLYKLRPQLKVLRGEGKPLPAVEAATLLTDAQTALLQFVETDEHVYLFAFTKPLPSRTRARTAGSISPLKIYELATNRADLSPRVAQFLQAITTRDEAASAQARVLYDLLLKPAQEQLAGKTHFVILPDHILWNLPFQALRTEAERYLIEDAAVTYAASLTALSHITKLRRRPARSGQAATARLLIFANPTLSQQTMERLKALTPTAPDQPTRATAVDDTDILGKLPGAQLFTGLDAREDRFKTEAGKYQLLHLAAPAVLQETSPLFSLAALATDEQTKEDGRLEAREILSLDLSAALIVLPDSHIAAPRIGVSRALTGWMWAWFVAGCPATVISQWPVAAPSHNELMLELHRQLQRPSAPQAKAQAWPTAVRQLLKHAEYRHPYYWAGWMVLGDVRFTASNQSSGQAGRARQ